MMKAMRLSFWPKSKAIALVTCAEKTTKIEVGLF